MIIIDHGELSVASVFLHFGNNCNQETKPGSTQLMKGLAVLAHAQAFKSSSDPLWQWKSSEGAGPWYSTSCGPSKTQELWKATNVDDHKP